MWPKFPDICLTVEGNPRKNLNQGKVESVSGMKLKKREKPQKNAKNSVIAHHNCPPGNTETQTKDLISDVKVVLQCMLRGNDNYYN